MKIEFELNFIIIVYIYVYMYIIGMNKKDIKYIYKYCKINIDWIYCGKEVKNKLNIFI